MEHSVSLSRNLSLVWCGNICIIDHPVPRCPFAFSIVYTFVHMLMFSLYYVFFASEQFSSAVTQGDSVFLNGNMQRVVEMEMSLTMAVALFVVFQGWSYWTAKRKLSSAS